MKERFFSAIFSLNGLAILIGVTGFVSSVVTLSVDLSQTLSIKWFFGLTVFYIFSISVLVKILYDNSFKMELMPFEEQVIKYQRTDNNEIFIIRRNDLFTEGCLVGIYNTQGDIFNFICYGVVNHIQPKIIQIKPINFEVGDISPSIAHNYSVSAKIKGSELINMLAQ